MKNLSILSLVLIGGCVATTSNTPPQHVSLDSSVVVSEPPYTVEMDPSPMMPPLPPMPPPLPGIDTVTACRRACNDTQNESLALCEVRVKICMSVCPRTPQMMHLNCQQLCLMTHDSCVSNRELDFDECLAMCEAR